MYVISHKNTVRGVDSSCALRRFPILCFPCVNPAQCSAGRALTPLFAPAAELCREAGRHVGPPRSCREQDLLGSACKMLLCCMGCCREVEGTPLLGCSSRHGASLQLPRRCWRRGVRMGECLQEHILGAVQSLLGLGCTAMHADGC